ncbi:uncharacterized protein [Acropora muricata]|uniref:uncharacterized protein n=1 Tax=Acropora muricata TaxID=159855 RepID=UPI0034E59481
MPRTTPEFSNSYGELSGNVEVNPGPNEDIAQRKSKQTNVRCKVKMNVGLKICEWNINRLTDSKFEQIRHFLTSSHSEIDVLFLIETFLKPKVPDSVFEIPGYVMYRKDRPGVKQGGGILAYVNFKLKENRRIDLEEKEIETLWLDIFPFNSKRPLLVGALYRPPSSNVDIDSRIEKNIENAYLQNRETIIVGDFNINYLNRAYNSHRLAKALKNMALSQVISSVTRPKSGTCLDHCYTSHPAFIANTAHHLPLNIQRKYAKQRGGCESEHMTISYRETKILNLDELLQSLERIPWDTAFVLEDFDDILNALESMLNEVLDQHLPWKNRRVKRQNRPSWMNEEIMEWIRQRDNLLKIARRTNLSIDWSLYTRAKCKTSNSIKLQNDVSFKKQ